MSNLIPGLKGLAEFAADPNDIFSKMRAIEGAYYGRRLTLKSEGKGIDDNENNPNPGND